jgi:signal transduction histidine kinase
VPAGYLHIRSGLGSAPPCDIVIVPVVFENQVLGVIELASFTPFSDLHLALVDQLVVTIGVVLNTIMANARTEELLAQSQRLTQELRSQSVELQRTNNELEEKAALLEEKNQEIELARIGLEDKAEQLAQSSRYKSEFLANMSHELRTPLNSLLILAKLLSDNQEANLTPKQIEFADTIHSAGSELLGLINDILDLSKVEAGKMDVEPIQVRTRTLCDAVDQAFAPMAHEKGLSFRVVVADDVPAEFVTDEQRIQQVLRNLVSNAIKFTDLGEVRLDVSVASPDIPFMQPCLRSSPTVLAFAVSDTGIGVAADKLKMIFEAFQQADGTTSRRYGGTGLGLSISKETARLLGGSIAVWSAVGEGSTFTLYVPSVMPAETPHAALPGEPDDVLMILDARPAVVRPGHADGGSAGGEATGGAPTMATTAGGAGGAGGADESAGPEAAAGTAAAPPERCGVTDATPNGTVGAHLGSAGDDWTPFLTEPARPTRDKLGRPLTADRSDPLANSTVLVVDDDVRNVFALTSALEMFGMRVLYADNGHDAVRKIQQEAGRIDLVLMDVMLPGLDGNETTAAIRRIPTFASLPIVVLTAKAMPGDREKSLSAGATDYLTKPVDLGHLLDTMRLHLR